MAFDVMLSEFWHHHLKLFNFVKLLNLLILQFPHRFNRSIRKSNKKKKQNKQKIPPIVMVRINGILKKPLDQGEGGSEPSELMSHFSSLLCREPLVLCLHTHTHTHTHTLCSISEIPKKQYSNYDTKNVN